MDEIVSAVTEDKMTNATFEWYDKLFFFGLVLFGTGMFTCIFAFSAMLRATRS